MLALRIFYIVQPYEHVLCRFLECVIGSYLSLSNTARIAYFLLARRYSCTISSIYLRSVGIIFGQLKTKYKFALQAYIHALLLAKLQSS
eukprot:COSAG01_NODE_2336_length_7874_cov_42.809928_1_plen_88_part_10